MSVIVLPSFSKGEIGPSLHARVDTSMYRTGLAKARNCIIHPYGGISNRPGSVCIGPVKDHTVSTTRLFRFHLGDTDQYVLEFGNLYMRVIRNDSHVTETATTVTAATKANPVVITATSHGLSNGDEVVLNSIGGMVEISSGRYIVANKTTDTFVLTNQTTGNNVDGSAFTAFSASGSDTVAEIFELVTPYAAADLSTLKMVQSGNVITITHPSYAPRDLTRTDHNVWSLTTLVYAPALDAPTNLTASASTNNNFQVFQNRNQTVRYEVTSISDTDEFFEESLAIQVTLTDSSDPPLNTLTWTAESDAQRYAIYRQDNGLFGLVGETEATTFEDDNFASDLTISPPRARNPFTGSGNFPATSGYYEQRQLYGGTNNSPDTWFASQTGLRLNMSVSSPLQADDAITASLSSQDVQIIRHFVPLDDLLIFTNSGEWRVNSGGDSHFSADTVKQKPQEFWGSDHMQPIIIGKTIFYVEEGGGRVRSLGFSLQADGYQSSDMNLLANHLLVEDGPDEFIITDWTHQQFPEPRLYIVRSDGQILTMTFNQEQQVIAWTTWDTNGSYESITSLRRSLSNVEDGVYYIVQRKISGNIVRLIERMHTRKFADPRDAHFVDAGHRLDSQLTITDITDANPAVLTSVAHGLSNGDNIELTDIEWTPTVDSFGNETNPTQYNNLRFTVANKTTDTFELLSHTTETAGEGWDLATISWGTTFDTSTSPTIPISLEMGHDGTYMYIAHGGATVIVFQYDLSTAYDITTATLSSNTLNPAAQSTDTIRDGFLNDDGTRYFLYHGNPSNRIYRYDLSTPGDLSTAVYASHSFFFGSVAVNGGVTFSADGLQFYYLRSSVTSTIFAHDLGAAFSFNDGITFTSSFITENEDALPKTLEWKPDGTKLYIIGDFNNKIYQYSATIAFELSSVSYDNISVDAPTNKPTSLAFRPNGTRIYSADTTSTLFQSDLDESSSVVDVGLASTEVYESGGVARLAVTQVTGIHCLEGETVVVNLDGNVEADYTVADGKITIRDGRSITRASIGFPYTSDIETLNIEVPSPPGTIQDKVKKITDVMIRFYKSRMPFIGPNNTDMIEMKGRELEKIGEATSLLTGDRTVNIPPSWNSNGRLFIRMRQPVPFTILGIFPDVYVEDD